ncbi:MAG: CRISPR-associated protein Cas4 [Acidimicrobiales bacterium]
MPVPISALEHYEYCPRQCALIHVDGVWAENRHTARGGHFHRRVDAGRPSRSGRVRTLRGIELWSEQYDLVGRADAVEVDGYSVVPVEYKAGTRHGMTAKVQLCAEALCLEEMFGLAITTGAIWYGAHRRRERVAIDAELRAITLNVIEAVADLADEPRLPPPVNDRRCRECQLIGFCLPAETDGPPDRASTYLAEVIGVPAADRESEGEGEGEGRSAFGEATGGEHR